MVAADVAPLVPVCSAWADALPRLVVALGLPADAAMRMASRLADFETRARARSLALDLSTLALRVGSHPLGVREAGAALAAAGAPRDTSLDVLLDALSSAGAVSARIVERIGPGDAPHVELHLDVGRLGLAAWSLVESVLGALHLRRGWHRVLESAPRGPLLDECVGLGIHLEDGEPARVEARIRRRDVSADLLVAIARAIDRVDPQRAMRAFYRLTDGVPGRLAPTTSLCFDVGGSGEPIAMRLAVPIRAWARHDAEVCTRVDALRVAGDGGRVLRAALSTMLARGLDQRAAAIGIEMEWRAAHESVLVELSPDEIDDDAFDPPALATATSPWSNHPLLVRVERDAVTPSHAWVILAELFASVVEPSARRWCGLVARIDDDAVRSILAHELATELGHGDVDRSVARRIRRSLGGAPAEAAARPQSQLSARLDAIVADEHPYVGVGAALALRRFGADVATLIAMELRRHGHDDAAAELDALIVAPADALAVAIRHEADRRAMARGERAVLAAAWAALDDLDRAL
jgi:hypothetical protein